MIAVKARAPQTRLAERSLIERFKAGDRAAFEEVVRLHQPRLIRLAHRLLGWSGEADDVVQDVFVSALENLHRFRADSSLKTWLTTLTVNRCRGLRRRRMRWLAFFGRSRHATASAAESAGADRGLDDETLEAVRAAVRKLPGRLREVIVLRYLEQMEIDDICEVLSISRSAADVRLHRARERLRQQLKRLAPGFE